MDTRLGSDRLLGTHGAGGEKSTLQGSGLVRTVGPCAQKRVALMPRAIATARDAFC